MNKFIKHKDVFIVESLPTKYLYKLNIFSTSLFSSREGPDITSNRLFRIEDDVSSGRTTPFT